jgi:hypothetical protein
MDEFASEAEPSVGAELGAVALEGAGVGVGADELGVGVGLVGGVVAPAVGVEGG